MTGPTIYQVRGISEPMFGNMFDKVSALVPDARVIEIPWSASYGPVPQPLGEAFAKATGDAVPRLLQALDEHGPGFVGAFSGGCYAAGHVADIGHRNLLGVALIADPFQPVGVAPGLRFGIAGSRPIRSHVPVKWAFNLADAICCCERDSPLRTLADQTSALSLSDPIRWGLDLADRAARNRWQRVVIPWNNPRATWDLYGRAINDALAYAGRLGPSPHLTYGAPRGPRPSWTTELARWITETHLAAQH